MFLFVFLASLQKGGLIGSTANLQSTTDIGIEHEGALTVSLSMTVGRAPGLVDISHDGKESIGVSVPTSWSRREVRHARLEDVTVGPDTFGFTRYTLPTAAEISFTVASPTEEIFVHNASSGALSVRYKKINLETNETSEDVLLVKEGKVRLW